MTDYTSFVLQHFFAAYQVPPEIRRELRQGNTRITWPSLGMHFFSGDLRYPRDRRLALIGGHEVPVFFAENAAPEVVSEDTDGTRIHFDWVHAAFYFLSGFQELPRFGTTSRFSRRESIDSRLGVGSHPFVNVYFELVKDTLAKVYHTEIPAFPIDALLLSHDIDTLKSGWKLETYSALKQGALGGAARIVANAAQGQQPTNNLHSIMQQELDNELQATYFFLASQEKGNADYAIESEAVQKLLKHIASHHEVALHGALHSHSSQARLREERALIGDVTGNRMHYLYFDALESVSALEGAGLKYDATLGYFDAIGYKRGYCHPHLLWNWAENRASDVLSIPLNIMDVTLWADKYLGLSIEKSRQLVREVFSTVLEYQGSVSVLWHNNYFSNYAFRGWGQLYFDLAKEAIERGFRCMTHNELCEIMHTRFSVDV